MCTTAVPTLSRVLCAAVTIEELCRKLEEFGLLRPDGVNLKTQRGKDSYAFVDFQTVEAAQVRGRQCFVHG